MKNRKQMSQPRTIFDIALNEQCTNLSLVDKTSIIKSGGSFQITHKPPASRQEVFH